MAGNKFKFLKNLSASNWRSIALPIVLMVTGAVLMGADGLGTLSLDNIKNFWPMAIILVGLVELIPSEDTHQGARNE